MDLNRATIIGRLTRDPETRTTTSGINVTNFSVATSTVWTDAATKEKKEIVEYHNIVAWRKLGEIVAQYLHKGSQVFVEGRLQTRSWDGQDGVKRFRTEIVADNLIMLGSKSGAATPVPQGTVPEIRIEEAPAPAKKNESEEISVEDIPF